MNYTDELLDKAMVFAIESHGNQMYGKVPYMKHLQDVVNVGVRFGLSNKHLMACWLHDVIEDTSVSFNKVEELFGREVAEMVYCVTDELGRTRNERKAKTLPKIAANPDSILVKLADRIANVESGGKIDMYIKEYRVFKFTIYRKDDLAEPMWIQLESLLKIKENRI